MIEFRHTADTPVIVKGRGENMKVEVRESPTIVKVTSGSTIMTGGTTTENPNVIDGGNF